MRSNPPKHEISYDSTEPYLSESDRKGQSILPGDRVRFAIGYKNKHTYSEGTVAISRRSKASRAGGPYLPALVVVDDDGTIYNLATWGVMKLDQRRNTDSYAPKPRAGTNIFGAMQEKRRGPRMNQRPVALMMLRAIEYNIDLECPFTQTAVDEISKEIRGGRSGLLSFLRWFAGLPTDDDEWSNLTPLALVTTGGPWFYVKEKYVKKATGKTCQQWLTLIEGVTL